MLGPATPSAARVTMWVTNLRSPLGDTLMQSLTVPATRQLIDA